MLPFALKVPGSERRSSWESSVETPCDPAPVLNRVSGVQDAATATEHRRRVWPPPALVPAQPNRDWTRLAEAAALVPLGSIPGPLKAIRPPLAARREQSDTQPREEDNSASSSLQILAVHTVWNFMFKLLAIPEAKQMSENGKTQTWQEGYPNI